jgi:dCTP deaminase
VVLTDRQIKKLATEAGMIDPFVPGKVRGGISYGLSHTGYDIRLSDKEAVLVKPKAHGELDPKNPDSMEPEPLELMTTIDGSKYFVLPPLGVMLGVAAEKLTMPDNIMALVQTKSTYARYGVFANITPIEAGWLGYLTMEIKNMNPNASVRVYANEGIAQLVFLSTLNGEVPESVYNDTGKYQNQPQSIVLGKAG